LGQTGKRPLQSLPALAKLDADDEAVSVDYSVALDYWGTELQKAGHLKEAHSQFAEAVRLNTNNLSPPSIFSTMNACRKATTGLLKDPWKLVARPSRLLWIGVRFSGATVRRMNRTWIWNWAELAAAAISTRPPSCSSAASNCCPAMPEAELAMAKTYVDTSPTGQGDGLDQELRSSSKITLET
jgi:hypothetical protein